MAYSVFRTAFYQREELVLYLHLFYLKFLNMVNYERAILIILTLFTVPAIQISHDTLNYCHLHVHSFS